MKLKTLKMVLTKSAAIAAAAGMILTSAVPAQADTDGTIQSITADDGSSGITATVSGQEETVGDDSASGQPGTQETGEKTEDSAEEASGQQSADNAGEESGQQTSESTGQESGDKTADSAGKESGQKAAESKEEASVSVPYTAANTTDIYRMYNSTSGEHLYTSDTNERNVLLTNGWTYEGQGWTSPNKGVNNAQPVYRLYNPAEGGHLYTMDAHERDVLAGQYGWNYEGIGWYSDAEKSIPVYREFNPGASKNGHNFTASETEDRILVSQYHFNNDKYPSNLDVLLKSTEGGPYLTNLPKDPWNRAYLYKSNSNTFAVYTFANKNGSGTAPDINNPSKINKHGKTIVVLSH